jgi:hypothetical protein
MGNAGASCRIALIVSTSTVVVAALLAGFVAYLAVNQRLSVYAAIVGL